MNRIINYYEGMTKPHYEHGLWMEEEDKWEMLGDILVEYNVQLVRLAIFLKLDKIEEIFVEVYKAALLEELCEKTAICDKFGSLVDFGYCYDPTRAPSVHHFRIIAKSTQCIFSPTSKMWGSPGFDLALTLEQNIERFIPTLINFILISRLEHLDAFVFEFTDPHYSESVETVGATMKRLLTCLDRYDPGKSNSMGQDLTYQGWQFMFNFHRIFVTSFAPCYAETHPRWSYGTKSLFVLFQPECSFGFHNIPPMRKPNTVRDKIRNNFLKHGRPYETPSRHDLNAQIYVKPNNDMSDPRVVWWN